MELTELALILAINAIFTAIVGVIVGLAVSYFRDNTLDRKINNLAGDMDSLVDSINGKQGVTARREKSERQQSAMLEFATLMQQPNAKIDEVLKAVGGKYPDVAMDLMKKGLKI
jgi:hypothetical protein